MLCQERLPEISFQTKSFLKEMTGNSSWILNGNGSKTPTLALQLGQSAIFGIIGKCIVDYFTVMNGNEPASGTAFKLFAGFYLSRIPQRINASKAKAADLENKLKNLVDSYQQNLDLPNSSEIVDDLKSMATMSKAYAKSSIFFEKCLAGTFLAAAFASDVTGYLIDSRYGIEIPENLQAIVLGTGLVATSAFAFYHRWGKSKDFEKISQKVTDCLNKLPNKLILRKS